MSATFTKSMARNVFYGGGVFFFLLFLALTFDTTRALPKRDNSQNITPAVAHGKKTMGNKQLYRLPHFIGRRCLLCPRVR
jgi:nitric oxide reductase subunit C